MKRGRPKKYATESERTAAEKARRRESKKNVRNVTITAESAEQLLAMRDQFNASGRLPFKLTTSQFVNLLLAQHDSEGIETLTALKEKT